MNSSNNLLAYILTFLSISPYRNTIFLYKFLKSSYTLYLPPRSNKRFYTMIIYFRASSSINYLNYPTYSSLNIYIANDRFFVF